MATFNSTQYANQIAIPPVLDRADQSYGKVRFQKIDYTQINAGADGDEVNIIKLPPGRVTLIGPLSYLRFSALGASRVWKLGWLSYKDRQGNVVAASLSGIQSGVDVSAAVQTNLAPAAVDADGLITFDSLGGVVLQGEVTGGTIPAAATILGGLMYTVE